MKKFLARGDLDRGGATTASGILGHLGATTNGARHIRKVILFCFSRSRDRPPQMAIFNRPTECVNNTPSTTAHFQRLRTPAHACTHFKQFLCVAHERYYKQKNHEALHQQRSIPEEQLQQQQRDDQRNLSAEATIHAAQTSTQLNAEFRVMELTLLPKRTSSTKSRWTSSQLKLRRLKIEESKKSLHSRSEEEKIPIADR